MYRNDVDMAGAASLFVGLDDVEHLTAVRLARRTMVTMQQSMSLDAHFHFVTGQLAEPSLELGLVGRSRPPSMMYVRSALRTRHDISPVLSVGRRLIGQVKGNAAGTLRLRCEPVRHPYEVKRDSASHDYPFCLRCEVTLNVTPTNRKLSSTILAGIP